jgi:hypothetical protein
VALSTRLQTIRNVIERNPGITCEGVEKITSMSHQTVSAAITGLVEKGEVVIIGTVVPAGGRRSVRSYRVRVEDIPDHVIVDFTNLSQNARRFILKLIKEKSSKRMCGNGLHDLNNPDNRYPSGRGCRACKYEYDRKRRLAAGMRPRTLEVNAWRHR